jgi:hypothetical protein
MKGVRLNTGIKCLDTCTRQNGIDEVAELPDAMNTRLRRDEGDLPDKIMGLIYVMTVTTPKKTGNVRTNVTVMRVRITIVTVENQ